MHLELHFPRRTIGRNTSVNACVAPPRKPSHVFRFTLDFDFAVQCVIKGVYSALLLLLVELQFDVGKQLWRDGRGEQAIVELPHL